MYLSPEQRVLLARFFDQALSATTTSFISGLFVFSYTCGGQLGYFALGSLVVLPQPVQTEPDETLYTLDQRCEG